MNKAYLILGVMFTVLLLGGVWAAVTFFHQTNVDLTVTEARSSADVPFHLSCFSGDTVAKNVTIHNNAVVPLKAMLSWAENVNTGNVTYTNNLPANLTLAGGSDTTFEVTFTCDEISDSGSVNGTIDYNKIK